MGLLKKIGRTVKKTVRKVVPKEVAGIMTAAAPFVAPYSLPAAAALSIGGQLRTGQGRINPIVTGMSLLPGLKFDPTKGAGSFIPRGFTRFGQDAGRSDLVGLRSLLFGGPGVGESGKLGAFGDRAEGFLFGTPGTEAITSPEGTLRLGASATDPTQGLLGFGGEFGTGGSLISTMKDGAPVISKTKVAAAAAAGLSLAQTQAQIEEEADEAGLSSSELARLQQEAAEMWEDFDTTAFRPKITAAIGGLMRKNLAQGTVNPFKPKPEDYGIEDNELPADPKPFRPKPNVGKMADVRGVRSLMPEVLEDEILIERDLRKASPESSYNTVDFMIEQFEEKGIAPKILGKGFQGDEEIFIIETPRGGSMLITVEDYLKNFSRINREKGGLMRANYALGSMPTKEESGLGGLPIEADMRYTGGFMPYGAKEKADDVPARLSKNEFVFTADAVRAAGGGSVQKGAQRMYNTMKQLESMGKMA